MQQKYNIEEIYVILVHLEGEHNRHGQLRQEASFKSYCIHNIYKLLGYGYGFS